MDAREFSKLTKLPTYLFLKWKRLGKRKNLIKAIERVSYEDAKLIDFDIMPNVKREYVEKLGIPIRTQDVWIKEKGDYRYNLLVFSKWVIMKGLVDDLIEV